jgi:hypothetical protein
MNWDSLPVIRRIHRISYNDTNTSFQNQIVPDQLRWWWWLFLSLSLITGIIIMIIIYNNMMMFIIIMLLLLLWFLSYYCDMIFMLLLWHIAIVNDEYFCRSFPSDVPRSRGEAILEEVCTHLEEAACRAASAPMTCQVLMTSGTLKDHQNGDLMVIWWYFLWWFNGI